MLKLNKFHRIVENGEASAIANEVSFCSQGFLQQQKGLANESERMAWRSQFSQGFLPKAKRLRRCHMLIGKEKK